MIETLEPNATEGRVDLALKAYQAVIAVGTACAANPTERNIARRREIYRTAIRLFRSLTPDETKAIPPTARTVIGVIQSLQ